MSFEKMYIMTPADAGASSDREANDYYPTPPVATYSLVRCSKHQVPSMIHEPAAGRGWMSCELQRLGHEVVSTDLFGYHDPMCEIETGVDFLESPRRADAMITNPPYHKRLPEKFISHAMDVGYRYIAVLCRLTFAESMRRGRFFTENPPSEILIFSSRFNCDESYFFASERGQLGGMVAYAWFVWCFDDGPIKETTVKWIQTDKMLDAWLKENPDIVFQDRSS